MGRIGGKGGGGGKSRRFDRTEWADTEESDGSGGKGNPYGTGVVQYLCGAKSVGGDDFPSEQGSGRRVGQGDVDFRLRGGVGAGQKNTEIPVLSGGRGPQTTGGFCFQNVSLIPEGRSCEPDDFGGPGGPRDFGSAAILVDMMNAIFLHSLAVKILAESQAEEVELLEAGFGDGRSHRSDIRKLFGGVEGCVPLGEIPGGMNIEFTHHHGKISTRVGLADQSAKFFQLLEPSDGVRAVVLHSILLELGVGGVVFSVAPEVAVPHGEFPPADLVVPGLRFAGLVEDTDSSGARCGD